MVNIQSFLESLSTKLPSRLDVEYKVMSHMKRTANPMGTDLSGKYSPIGWHETYLSLIGWQYIYLWLVDLLAWDVPFLSSTAKHTWFSLDLENVSQYFSLGVAMEGLNSLFQSIYGVELMVETAEEGELWSSGNTDLWLVDTTLF